MLHIRVLTAGAMMLMMAGAAAAQSDEVPGTAPAPGKPISLLQILLKPASRQPAQDDQAAPTANDQTQPVQRRTYRRVAHRHRWTRKYAHRRVHDDEATATAPSPGPAPTPARAAATETQAADTANTPAAPDQPNIGAMAVGGSTAQAASPDPADMTDMTAGSMQPAVQQAITAPPQGGSAMPPSDAAAAQLAPEGPQPAALDQSPETGQTIAMASTVQQDGSTDRSRDRWYENLLAALSGAFVAASLAWIKIGLTPPRRSQELMLSCETESLRR